MRNAYIIKVTNVLLYLSRGIICVLKCSFFGFRKGKHGLRVRWSVSGITNTECEIYVKYYWPIEVSFLYMYVIPLSHSARRPRTFSGRSILGRMKVFRTSLFIADVEKTFYRRRVQVGRTNYVLRTPGRKRTSGKLSYGPKVGRPLNVTSENDVLRTTLAEWVGSLRKNNPLADERIFI